jgi:cytochrome c oxidase cbb3-type subunit I/II
MAQGKLLANEPAEAPTLLTIDEKASVAHWHRWIEKRPIQLLVASLIMILIGSLVELVPTFMVKSNMPTIAAVKPYSALELEGRDIYIREGCVSCHSQLVRPFRSETERYGDFSKSGEFVYDHPFLWGSKRTGPDLHREGGKYPNSWHYYHMKEPSSMSPGSIMPAYDWLYEQTLNTSMTQKKLSAMKTLGVPYDDGQITNAVSDLNRQAKEIQTQMAGEKIKIGADKEIIALIAYLQRLGTDINKKQ